MRAEVTADVDFSHSEQAAEIYKPNQTPDAGAVRSQQSSESQTAGSRQRRRRAGRAVEPAAGAGHRADHRATTPLQPTPAAPRNAAAGAPPQNPHKESTVNYEVDKTIRYVQQPMGGVKRLSVAVVVNYKREAGRRRQDGQPPARPTPKRPRSPIWSRKRWATTRIAATP